MPTTIHPFPEMRAYAEREARARVLALHNLEGEWMRPDCDVATETAIELRLLCDLTRPASRDAVCRLISDTFMDGWTFSRVHRAVEWTGLDWQLLCERALVPERLVCGPDAPRTETDRMVVIVTHLWPSEP